MHINISHGEHIKLMFREFCWLKNFLLTFIHFFLFHGYFWLGVFICENGWKYLFDSPLIFWEKKPSRNNQTFYFFLYSEICSQRHFLEDLMFFPSLCSLSAAVSSSIHEMDALRWIWKPLEDFSAISELKTPSQSILPASCKLCWTFQITVNRDW